jgi:hypothetical protein
VAKRIDPTTVSFASLTDPDGTRVVEQNYQFDLVSQQKLLERYVGATISVDQQRGDHVETITGKLLSASGGLILAKDSGEVVTLQTTRACASRACRAADHEAHAGLADRRRRRAARTTRASATRPRA